MEFLNLNGNLSENSFMPGTWFLSYLCDIGLFTNDDAVQDNYLTGKNNIAFCGIPKDSNVYITMSERDQMIIHYATDAEVDQFEHETGDSWFIHDKVKKITKKIHIALSD